MGECCYIIKEIPDLTLGKYDYLSHNGVDGVLELHRSLLRQLHEKSILTKVTMHLLYYYQHDGAPGNKIHIYFFARGKNANLNNIDKLLKGSALAEYFTFSFLYRTDDSGNIVFASDQDSHRVYLLQNRTFSYCTALTKEEVFFDGRDGEKYYIAPPWKPNEDGRLYDMLRIMEALDEDFVYRIDIRAEKRNRVLRKMLTTGQNAPIVQLHALQGNIGDRDYGADSMLRAYEELMKGLDSQPHFEVNAFVLSDNSENGSLVIASAASEAIENGDYVISSYEGAFHCKSLLDSEDSPYYSIDDKFVLNIKNGHVKIRNCLFADNGTQYSMCEKLAYLSSLYTLEELEPLFRLPALYDGEHLEIRKETVAPIVEGNDVLYLGVDTHGYPVNIPLELLPKHAFVSGVPGSGKTNTMHHLTHSLWNRENPIPFLVLEPAKKEYRALLNLPEMKDVRLFSPCSDMSFPLHINPFEFAKGLSVSEHIGTLCDVFEGAFPLDNPMPFLLQTTIEKVYKQKGWRPEDRYTGKEDKEFPTMSMLYNELEKELATTTYSSEVKGNLESALKVRIGSLLRREMGDVFDVERSSLAPEEWITTPAIVELESMGKGPANFTTLMLCALIREVLKVNPAFNGPVRHVIFIEEAHNLIGPDSEEKSGSEANAKTAATAFIVNMLAEVRALKESIFIADQLPTAMAQEVIKNTGLKIALRLTAMDDRQLLCNSMSANNSQIEEMGSFKIGQALVAYEKLLRPFKMRVNLWCGDKPEEERERLTSSRSDPELVKFLQTNRAYRDNLSRSVVAEFKKLAKATFDFTKRSQKLLGSIDQLRAIKARKEQLDRELQEINEQQTDILMSRGDDDLEQVMADPEYYNLTEEMNQIVGEIEQCRNEVVSISQKFTSRAVDDLIEEALELCHQLNHKRVKFWRLGMAPTAEEATLFQTAPMEVPIASRMICIAREILIRQLLEDAAAIYNRSTAYFATDEKAGKNIAQMANILQIKTTVKILRSEATK